MEYKVYTQAEWSKEGEERNPAYDSVATAKEAALNCLPNIGANTNELEGGVLRLIVESDTEIVTFDAHIEMREVDRQAVAQPAPEPEDDEPLTNGDADNEMEDAPTDSEPEYNDQ